MGLIGAGAGAALAFAPDSASAAPAPRDILPVAPILDVADFGGVGDGVADDTLAIQDAINAASVMGGIVYLRAGKYRLTRQPGEATLTLLSNVTLRGDGYGTEIFLETPAAPDDTRHYVMRVGSKTAGASNVVVENIRLVANYTEYAKRGGGSLMGICARHDGPDKTIHSDNIYVRNCYIYDTQIAVGCTKSAVTGPYPPERLNGQFRNWVVENCVLDKCGNKMIEFGECNFGLIRNNVITQCDDGPQAIFHSRNILIEGNYVSYRVSGINVTAGSNNIAIVGNVVEAAPDIAVSNVNSALYLRTEATVSTDYLTSDVRSIGNIYRDRYTNTKRAFRTGTRPEVNSTIYERVTFVGDTFDGNVQMADLLAPGKTTIRDFTFTDCIFMGDIPNVVEATMPSSDVTFQGCDFRRTAGYTINAKRWSIQNSRIRGPLTLTAADTVISGNRLDGPVTGTPKAVGADGNYVY